MSEVHVTAKRWERGWELHIDGYGVTQTKSLRLADRDTRDYVELLSGARPDVVHLTTNVGKVDAHVKRARRKQQDAAKIQAEASALSKQVIAELAASGLSKTDIAKVLDLSPQRISQLTTASATPRATMSRAKSASSRGKITQAGPAQAKAKSST